LFFFSRDSVDKTALDKIIGQSPSQSESQNESGQLPPSPFLGNNPPNRKQPASIWSVLAVIVFGAALAWALLHQFKEFSIFPK
jgi:hypothetical protein